MTLTWNMSWGTLIPKIFEIGSGYELERERVHEKHLNKSKLCAKSNLDQEELHYLSKLTNTTKHK